MAHEPAGFLVLVWLTDVPPSLTQQQTTSVKVDIKTRPKVAMPKPVPDDQAVEETIAISEDFANQGQLDLSDGFGEGDSLVIDASSFGLPGANDYVAFEKAPELVSMDNPTYPDLAREAGVEGTILLRVLVGEDGLGGSFTVGEAGGCEALLSELRARQPTVPMSAKRNTAHRLSERRSA